jgi:LPS sulfotransferase NodH
MGGFFHNLRHPRQCYMVCAVGRSRSNLLTDALHATRVAGRPKQFFLPKFELEYGPKHDLNPADFAGYVKGIVEMTATPNEVFGFKVMGWYLREFMTRLRKTEAFGDRRASEIQLLENAFPRLKFLHVRRRNKVQQAVSRARVLQEGTEPRAELWFDEELISRCLHEIEVDETVWSRFFEVNGATPHLVFYEDLCQHYAETLTGVLDFLEIRLPKGTELPELPAEPQLDSISRDWEERYLRLHPATQIPQTA